MNIHTLAVIVTLCLPNLLHAQGTAKPVDYQARYQKCLKDAGGARNATVGACAETVASQAAREIGRLYLEAHASIGKRNAKDAHIFESSHKAWVAYRDSHCRLAGAYVGSPMHAFCPMQLNIARVNELREFQ